MNSEKSAGDGEMTIEVFLRRLEKKAVVSQNVLADLRKLIAQAKTPVSAYRLAKILVDNRVLADVVVRGIFDEDLAEHPKKLRRAEEIPSKQLKKAKADASEDLGFAPDKKIEDAKVERQAASNAAAAGSLFDDELPPLSAGLSNIASGGIGDLWNDPNFAALLGEANPLESSPPRKKGYFHTMIDRLRRRAGGKLPWPWIGAAAAGLLILFVMVILIVNRSDPDEMLVPADALYESGSYAESITKYDEYLETYSKREAAGRARVRRDLAQLRLAWTTAANGAAALDVVKQIVPPIRLEESFNAEAAVLLADLLPQVAERLMQEAKKRPTPEALARLQEILTLADDLIPKKDRPRERFGRVEAALSLMRYRTSADEELKKATAAMRQAIATKDFQAAYRVRKTFRKTYPALSESEDLVQATSEIAEAERSAVVWTAKQRKASPAASEKPRESVILAYRRFDAAPPDAEGRVIFAAARGTVYALSAADGKILWRKYVGLDIDSPLNGIVPKPINSQPASDAVLLTARRGEIQRVEAATGRVRWRHVIGESYCSEPVVADDRILVATSSGRIVSIDAASGDSPGYVQLPQSLSVAPAVDVAGTLIFQVADHDNLFVIGSTGGHCRQVFQLGHALGAITTPPAIHDNRVSVSIHDATGHISPRTFSLKPNAKEPLQLIQESEKKARSSPSSDVGPTVYAVRTRENMPGTVVSAADAKSGRIYWQTHLAVPLVEEPWIDSDGKMTVVTALGTVYRLDVADSEKNVIADQPTALPPLDLTKPITDIVRFNKNICVLTCGLGSDRVFVYNPSDAAKQLRTWLLPGKISCPPIAFADGLLVPCDVGQVFLLDPLTGKPRATPFQPPLQREKLPAWHKPIAVNERECIITDGHGKLYRLQVVDKPTAHLASYGKTPLPSSLISPLALSGKSIYGLNDAGTLTVLEWPKLESFGEFVRVQNAWGLRCDNNSVTLAADDSHLYCFGSTDRLIWHIPLPYGTLAGAPLALGNYFVLASTRGVVWRVDRKNGKELGKLDLGQPLATGPITLDGRLFLGGRDGVLYSIKSP